MPWPDGPLPIVVVLTLLIGHLLIVRQRLAPPDSLMNQIRERERAVAAAEARLSEQLQVTAGLTPDQARTRLEAEVVEAAARHAAGEAQARAQDILLSAVSRVAVKPAELRFASTVELPGTPELRSRLIGPGGANVQAFERVTGAELSLPQAGTAATVVAFNPFTRHLAARTLSALTDEKRISPPVIESVYESVVQDSVADTLQRGRDAAHSVGVLDLPDELLLRLGQLAYHWRSGRDLLQRSVVGAQIAGQLACEVDIEPGPAQRAALLRDVGQTLDLEDHGPHGSAGARLAMEFGETLEVGDAIRDHHLNPTSAPLLSVLVSTADQVVSRVAAANPRFEAAQPATRRLRHMQEFCERQSGVARADVLRGGDEIRVLVDPDGLPEGREAGLALTLARRIRDDFHQSVSVTVIRRTVARSEAGPT